MNKEQENTSTIGGEYVDELQTNDMDMVIYRMIGSIGAKLLNI